MAGLDAVAILRSGQCLATATLASVKEGLAEQERRLEELFRAYTSLERQMITAQATIRQHQALLAPVRTLPTDVLLLIFLALEDHSVKAGGPRFVVGQVCKHWRSVSRSSPALWSTLNIVPMPGQTRVDIRGTSAGPHPSVLRTYLSLSLPHPLSIRVESTCAASKFMLPIAAHSRRIRHLTLWTHRLGIWRFIADCNGVELQQLQSLVLWQQDYKDNAPGPDISKQIVLPALQIYTSNLQNPFISVSNSLRDVTAAFPSTEKCVSLLSGLGALEVLHITHFTQQELCPSQRMGGLSIERLRVLKLSPCAICPALGLFTFPNLQELFIVRDSPLPHRNEPGEEHHVLCFSTAMRSPSRSRTSYWIARIRWSKWSWFGRTPMIGMR
ncbi:hypothetical protein CYLTODRAFT_28739 [Cylindrobasidium torrendii FP15055 ss-10]|uniref:F-box domain-containing protein n=1 Tax=Cylindrobasidium torrendii FP15055 ss-10 TaxID=1314674 RepID=A0A0D7BQ82_9AGAR|nr:hypothetical protein CYLTODRAFT_28739 [Cylindrobasidium torrendii FP15055 ss-10]